MSQLQKNTEIEALPPRPARSHRIKMAALLGMLAAIGPLSIDMYLPSLPTMTEHLQTTPSLVQLSLTFFLAGMGIGQLFAGPMSDVYGRRIPLLVGLSIFTVSSFLCAFSPSIEALIVLRLIQGLSGSVGVVISRATVRDMYSGVELTKFFALLMLVNGAAPILAPIAGGQLLRFTTWSGVFIVLSLLGVFMFISAFFSLPETLPRERRSKSGIRNTVSTFSGLIRDRIFMGYALSQGLVSAAMFAYISGSPFVIQKIYGASPQMYSLFFAINGLGIIIATQVTGRLAGRISETKLLIGGLCIASLAGVSLFTMIMLEAGLYGVMIPLFFVVSSVGMVSTASFSLAMQNQGKSAGSASALLGLLSIIFGALVAPLVGLGGEATAIPMGIVIACADIGSIVCYFVLIHRKKRRLNSELG
ncbi:multidrug effflux MFS transporter [Paenibacillus sp. J2TS4]|uniref:multidrug effflux MFS transporter n=1 Tax=Paenibacillus sp. J2TS4 TaxID=2807194 RepID=UPI001B275965|nr:multidrug effflux MFS transporter [Paenibacillus sp. J2TS4]GIP32118.1 Bcr/CflA family drug resistance efflux transporter [Paenibacillus sp. J2TS4]